MNSPIIEMGRHYPFGSGPTDVEDCAQMVVHKELSFEGKEEKAMIEQLLHFIKSFSHPSLINLTFSTEEPSSHHLYYEYVPLKLEPWILGVNEELAEQLEEQLLQLTDYLTRSNISFSFDPHSVGLDHNMALKYFLAQFSLDVEGQEQNRQLLQQQIRLFFSGLRKEAGIDNKPSAGKTGRFGSVSTNSSVSHLADFKSLNKSVEAEGSIKEEVKAPLRPEESKSSQQEGSRVSSLYEKVQSSKLKSIEVLHKLKNLSKNK